MAGVEHPAYRPFWALTRHGDIADVARCTALLVSAPRLTLIPRAVEERLGAGGQGREKSVRTIIDMDEPDHRKYRSVTQNWFLGPGVARFQGRVEAIARRFVDRIGEMDGRCDFAQDIDNWVPLHVIMSVLGLPEQDAPFILRSTQAMLAASDPEPQADQARYGTTEFQQRFACLGEVVERRNLARDLLAYRAAGFLNGGLRRDVGIRVSGAGHELEPTIALEQPIHRRRRHSLPMRPWQASWISTTENMPPASARSTSGASNSASCCGVRC